MSHVPSGDDLCYATIESLSRHLQAKTISPVELVINLLERIKDYNSKLNAFITITEDIAMEQAREAEDEILAGDYRGPLHGIPISLKDIIETKGIRTSCASMVAPDWVPGRDATVYARLRQAGAILAGKANLFEFAFSMNPAFPGAVNPWNPDRTSAGSSSGSAVGVAAGMAYASIGTDTAGSGRVPANANGTVGLKPTYGRVSRFGVFPLSYSLDHPSTMTRTVADSALMMEAVAGYDPNDASSSNEPVPDFSAKLNFEIRGMKIGLARGYSYEGIDPEVVAAMEAAASVFASLGAELSDVWLPNLRDCLGIHTAIMYSEAATVHYHALRESPEKFGEAAFMRLDLGSVIPATAYIHAQQVRGIMRDHFAKLLDEFDVIVGPAVPGRTGPAGSWITIIDGKEVDIRSAAPEYTGIYNLSGMPAIVLPAGFSSEGTPIGIQIAGAWFDEPTVLQVAHAFEQATQWHSYYPQGFGPSN